MVITEINTRKFWQPAETAISRTFNTGREMALSLTKPISNVSSQNRGFGTTPSLSEQVTYSKDAAGTSAMSTEEKIEKKSFVGTITENVKDMLELKSGIKTSAQKKGGSDIYTTGAKTTGVSFSTMNNPFKDVIDIGFNIARAITGNINDMSGNPSYQNVNPDAGLKDYNPKANWEGFEPTPLSNFWKAGKVTAKGSSTKQPENEHLPVQNNNIWIFILLVIILLMVFYRGSK